MSFKCQHEFILYDLPTDSEVCKDCGFVINLQALGGRDLDNSFTLNYSADAQELKLREDILHVLSCLYIDNGVVVDKVISFLKEYTDGGLKTLQGNNPKTKARVAYGIYRGLLSCGGSFSIKEIAYLCDVPLPAVLRAEKEADSFFTPSIILPSFFARRILSMVNVPGHLTELIVRIIEDTTNDVFALPETIVGAVLDELGHQAYYKKNLQFYQPELNGTREIAKFLGLTKISVMRARDRLPKETRERIKKEIEENAWLSILLEDVSQKNARLQKMQKEEDKVLGRVSGLCFKKVD